MSCTGGLIYFVYSFMKSQGEKKIINRFTDKKGKAMRFLWIPNEYFVAALSGLGFLKTKVWSSGQSQAMRSYLACSLEFNGLIRTVTSIFSSVTLEPPGVEGLALFILLEGVLGSPIIFYTQLKPIIRKRWCYYTNGRFQFDTTISPTLPIT